MVILTIGLYAEHVLRYFSLSVVEVLPAFRVSFIQSQTLFSGKKKLLGSNSKREHSWDMFKIGQTALHLKVDIYSSVDFPNYGKVR